MLFRRNHRPKIAEFIIKSYREGLFLCYKLFEHLHKHALKIANSLPFVSAGPICATIRVRDNHPTRRSF